MTTPDDWNKPRGTHDTLTPLEIEFIRARSLAGHTPREIAIALECSERTVHKWRQKFGIRFGRRPAHTTGPSPTPTEDSTAARDSNDRFVAAMRRAIANKQENPPIGVFKDDSPLVVRRMYGDPVSSGCGSSSAQCVDAADKYWGNK